MIGHCTEANGRQPSPRWRPGPRAKSCKGSFVFRRSMLWLPSKPYMNVSGISVVLIGQCLKTYQSVGLDPVQSLIFSCPLCWWGNFAENISFSFPNTSASGSRSKISGPERGPRDTQNLSFRSCSVSYWRD